MKTFKKYLDIFRKNILSIETENKIPEKKIQRNYSRKYPYFWSIFRWT